MASAPIPVLPDSERRTEYSPVASQGPFNVSFAIYGDSDDYSSWLEVWLDGVKLAATTDWTLSSPSGSLADLSRPITDAQVTLTAEATGTLEIVGTQRPRRTTQLTDGRPVTARDINRTVTELKAIAREFWDRMTRTPSARPAETAGPLPLLADRKNAGVGSLAGYDGTSGDPIAIPATAAAFADYTAASKTANSTTSLLIGTGTKTFTVEAGKALVANQWLLAMSKANNANNMYGQIVSYSGTTLVLSVVAVTGAGTLADWTLVLANSTPAAGFQPPVGTGTVTGPGSSTDGNVALFNGTTGQILKDAGLNFLAAKFLASSAIAFGVGMLNGTLVESHAANAVTIAVKTLAGADPSATDPVYFMFRSATAGSGVYVVRTVTAALSLTISAGSTLGFTSGLPGRIWVTAFDDAGTVRLGVINCLSGTTIYPLAAAGIASTSADNGSGGALAAQTYWTATGHALTSKSHVLLGYMTWESGLATAGTWNASPTVIRLYEPSVRLPGTTLQTRYSAPTATTTINSTTNTATALADSITPSSAVNLVKVSAFGSANCASFSTQLLTAQLYRNSGATAIGNVSPMLVNIGNTFNAPTANFALDAPRSSASVQYGLWAKLSASGVTATFLSAGAGAFTLEEIQT